MPEFDTYKAIERYAKHNNDRAAVQSYLMLKRRTRLSVFWRSICAFGVDKEQSATTVQMGAFSEEKKVEKQTDLASMTEKERLAMFMNAMDEVGMQLDPETLAEINKQGTI